MARALIFHLVTVPAGTDILHQEVAAVEKADAALDVKIDATLFQEQKRGLTLHRPQVEASSGKAQKARALQQPVHLKQLRTGGGGQVLKGLRKQHQVLCRKRKRPAAADTGLKLRRTYGAQRLIMQCMAAQQVLVSIFFRVGCGALVLPTGVLGEDRKIRVIKDGHHFQIAAHIFQQLCFSQILRQNQQRAVVDLVVSAR